MDVPRHTGPGRRRDRRGGIIRAATAAGAIAALGGLACGTGSDTPRDRDPAGGGDVAAVPEAAPAVARGCDGATRLVVPDDPAARGPWPVGVRTDDIGETVVEVWYPAVPGSERGSEPVRYDLRDRLPPAEAEKIPDAAAVLAACDCYRGLPVDAARGPYPVVVLLHGYSLYRTQNADLAAHWASRGFVVVAPDLDSVTLARVIGGGRRGDEVPTARAVARALAERDTLSGVGESVDLARRGAVGHSLGGEIAGQLGGSDGVAVVVAMAEGGTRRGPAPYETVVLGGTADRVEPYRKQRRGFRSSPAPKRFIGVEGAGHMAFTDVCDADPSATRVALDHGVAMRGFVAQLARTGCPSGTRDLAEVEAVVRHATTAALEETLWCSAGASEALASIRDVFGDAIADYEDARE